MRGAVVVLQTLFTYLPPLETLYDTRPIDWPDMGVAALAAIGLIVVLELEKAIRVTVRHRTCMRLLTATLARSEKLAQISRLDRDYSGNVIALGARSSPCSGPFGRF